LCPLPLFAELLRINHLRSQAAAAFSPAPTPEQRQICDGSDLSGSTWSILSRIEHGFSASDWADYKSRMSNPCSPTPISPTQASSTPARDRRHDWLLVGRAYQSAAALYCILSLQSVSLLTAPTPSSSKFGLDLQERCTAHARILRTLLAEGLASARIKRFLVWPLVVLGVCAHPGHGFLSSPGQEGGGNWEGGEGEEGEGLQEFVKRSLRELSCYAGSCVPLTAEGMLNRYWATATPVWDRCFDRPYVFTGQVAVDTKALYGF
jgi:hypothetical protein